MSPSDKDIDETEAKVWKLQGWLSAAKENPDQLATDPPIIKGELLGIEWKVSAVLSGDNFTEEMEEKCNGSGLRVVRSNGAGYGYARPSSASSVATAPTAPVSPTSSQRSSQYAVSPPGGEGGSDD